MIYLDLFLGFLKVGLFSFGGAYGAIPVIREVIMSNADWGISEEKFAYLLAISESTPGPIMVNTATYIGNEVAGIWGAMLATFTVCFPAFFIILLLSMILKNSLKNTYVQGVLTGIKPCIIGIILATGIFMILQHCIGSFFDVSADLTAIFMTAVLAAIYFGSSKVTKKGMSPIGLIGISAAAGIIVYGLI
jgi:chromate transporter